MSQEVKTDWNSVSDRLPPFGERVLIWNDKEPEEPPHNAYLSSVIDSERGRSLEWSYSFSNYVWVIDFIATHWMPLPPVPRLDFKCYEIHRPNIPQFGCEIQCKECKAFESKNQS